MVDNPGVVRTESVTRDASEGAVARANSQALQEFDGYDAKSSPARSETLGAPDRTCSSHSAVPALCLAMEDFLAYHELRGRPNTAQTMRGALRNLSRYLARHGIEPLAVTTQQLRGYQEYIVTEHRTPKGTPYKRTTQGRIISEVSSFYQWLEARGIIVTRPARTLSLRVPTSRVVVRQHLSLQEATAMLQTQARMIGDHAEGSWNWTLHVRNLAMLAVCLASGRRSMGVRGLCLDHVNLERRELRIEYEKGQTGRILPLAGWAIEVLHLYIERARPNLVKDPIPELFISMKGGPCGRGAMSAIMPKVIRRTIAENPDLIELPGKRITWQSLRVSFATLLFSNGCDIRSVNELMLHRKLSSTARYTPIPVEDLRQVCRAAHPRA